MYSDVFGEIEYEYGWFKDYPITILGTNYSVRLFIPCDEGAEIESAQKAAFIQFENNKNTMLRLAERAIYDYYNEIFEDYRLKFGVEFADQLAPKIENIEQLSALIKPTEIIVQQSFGSEDRIIGLLFSSSWEPELGLAVKFVNEAISEVGTQDIVL